MFKTFYPHAAAHQFLPMVQPGPEITLDQIILGRIRLFSWEATDELNEEFEDELNDEFDHELNDELVNFGEFNLSSFTANDERASTSEQGPLVKVEPESKKTPAQLTMGRIRFFSSKMNGALTPASDKRPSLLVLSRIRFKDNGRILPHFKPRKKPKFKVIWKNRERALANYRRDRRVEMRSKVRAAAVGQGEMRIKAETAS